MRLAEQRCSAAITFNECYTIDRYSIHSQSFRPELMTHVAVGVLHDQVGSGKQFSGPRVAMYVRDGLSRFVSKSLHPNGGAGESRYCIFDVA